MNRNVKRFNAFLTEKEKSIILHSLTVYMEKLDFVFKNSKYYDIDSLTVSFLKTDYEDIIKLRDKFFSIYTIDQEIEDKFKEGS